MNQYQTESSWSGISTAGAMPDAPMLPLAARIDQLRASIRAALDKTNNLTRYPQEEMPVEASKELSEASLLAEIDRAGRDMLQLLARLDRVNEAVGGRI